MGILPMGFTGKMPVPREATWPPLAGTDVSDTTEGDNAGVLPDDLSADLPPDAPPDARLAALRTDFDGLVELCRWQWNMIQRLRRHFELLPRNWPRPPEQ
ncbi:MAG: hypothetical protein PHU85_08045 [Phycisphaerae bacterium]|nr:hypothetical protein [Phycisphaerae bacterium]